MSASKSPLASALPLLALSALLGGVLWHLGESGLFAAGKTVAVALGFALLGGLLGVMARGQGEAVAQAKSGAEAQMDLAKTIADAIAKSQAGVAEQLQKAQQEIGGFAKQTQASGEAIRLGLSEFSGKAGNLGAGWSEQVMGAFKAHRDMLQSALEEVQRNSEAWRARFESSINAHSAGIEKSNRELAGTLEKIALLGRDIEKLLKVQETIDTTLENMARTDDFKRTMGRLAEDLENVERVLKDANRPRAIRLVESQAD
jgi:hypothetical protein